MKIRILFIIYWIVVGAACATNQKSRLASIGAGLVMGGSIGYAGAPDSQERNPNAALGAGLGATAAAIVSNYIFNDEDQLEKAKNETEKLKAELALFQNSQRVLIEERSGEYRDPDTGKKAPGRYSLKYYKVDRLQRIDKNKMIHVDREIEISPIESGN